MTRKREAASARADEAAPRRKISPVMIGGIGLLVLGFAGACGYVLMKPKVGARGAMDTAPLIFADDWVPRTRPAAGSLVLADFGGTGATMRPLEASTAHFDFAGDGFAERTAWPRRGTGIIGFLAPGPDGAQRFQILAGSAQGGDSPLAGFDETGDGVIDGADFWFSRIAVWNDVDGDGFIGDREIRSLSSYFVDAIALEPTIGAAIPPVGRALGEIRLSDGSGVGLLEARPDTTPADTVMLVPTSFQWDQRVYLLPNLRERGLIPASAFAMSADPELFEAGTRLSRHLLAGEVAVFREEFSAFAVALAAPGRGVPRFDDPRLEALAREAGFTRTDFEAEGKPAPSEARIAGNFERLVNDLALDFCLQAVRLHVPSMEDRMFAAHPLAWLETMRTQGGFEADIRVIVERGADEVGQGAMTPDDLIALIEITNPVLDPDAIRALGDRRLRARIDAALGPRARDLHLRLKALSGDA
jgi:hypothetical protein